MAESNQALAGRAGADSSSLVTAPSSDAPVSPARARLLELARFEQEQAVRVRTAREDFAQRAALLQKDVPALYFRMTRGLRDAVLRYNQNMGEARELLGSVSYSDTAGVALGEVHPGSEYLATVQRRSDRFDLCLRHMTSNRGYDVPIIEGIAEVGRGVRERVLMRIEGWVEKGQTIFWVSLDLHRVNIDVAELPDRILMAVVRGETSYLVRDLSPTPPRRRADADDDDDDNHREGGAR